MNLSLIVLSGLSLAATSFLPRDPSGHRLNLSPMRAMIFGRLVWPKPTR